MKKYLLLLILFGSLFMINNATSQNILYQESFADGNLSIDWFSAWTDSIGNPLTPMAASNEAGPTDDWIGTVTGDKNSLGSLGAALAGEPDLADYSIEANVYIDLDTTAYYQGIMLRADTTVNDTQRVVGYQFLASFYDPFFTARLRFRYFSQNSADIRNIVDIPAAEIPGGAPAESGWHKMKVKAVGNQFWLYWDDQEIAGSPFTDEHPSARSDGYFGVYTWNAFSIGQSYDAVTKVDDILVKGNEYRESFIDGNLSLDWFSAWTDSIGNPLTPMVASNEAGPTDDWIGTVTGDKNSLGSLGAALAGEPDLADYSIEANVYIDLDTTAYYQGIMLRADTTVNDTQRVVGYQFLASFYDPFFTARLRFRYFSQNSADIRNIVDIPATEIPGGAPAESGWHKMKVKAVGNQFWLYWDDQEIAGSPFTDEHPSARSDGYFGVYTWNAFSIGQSYDAVTKVDDIVVQPESPVSSIESPKKQLVLINESFVLHNNYPNPFNPTTVISFELKTQSAVKLTVYDANGRLITTLLQGIQPSGLHTINFDGEGLSSGVYYYTLQSKSFSETKKMLLIR